MKNNVKYYIQGIKKSLAYITERNKDIDIEKLTDDEIEKLDNLYYLKGNHKYIIVINNISFCIDFSTTVEDAQFIINNIQNITYVLSETENCDSVVGDVIDFINTKFDFQPVSFEFCKALFLYSKYVCSVTTKPEIDNILDYIKENIEI